MSTGPEPSNVMNFNEPWSCHSRDMPGWTIVNKNGMSVGRAWAKEIVDRIVACVNVCQGIPQNVLESGGRILIDVSQQGVPNYLISGTKEQVIEEAIKLLLEEGYLVIDDHD